MQLDMYIQLLYQTLLYDEKLNGNKKASGSTELGKSKNKLLAAHKSSRGNFSLDKTPPPAVHHLEQLLTTGTGTTAAGATANTLKHGKTTPSQAALDGIASKNQVGAQIVGNNEGSVPGQESQDQ